MTIFSGGITLSKSHNRKHKSKQDKPKFDLYVNALPVEEVPRSIPVKFLSYEQIKEVGTKELSGKKLAVKYVVMRTIAPSLEGGKNSISIMPLRNSAGEYQVIVCFQD